MGRKRTLCPVSSFTSFRDSAFELTLGLYSFPTAHLLCFVFGLEA